MPTNLTGSQINDTYAQLLHIDGGPEATEKVVYSAAGVATALKVGTQSVSVDNVRVDGNTISTLDTNGDLVLSPNGVGAVLMGNAQITGGAVSGITDLAVADGGTGASNAGDARTNLGLGSIATQDANFVVITGGTISGVTFSGSFAGMSLVEAVTLTGTTATNGGNLQLSANALVSTNTDGNIAITPDGAGVITLSAATTGTTIKATSAIGYAAGNGGTVTQVTSRTTGVTLNAPCGHITLYAAAIAGHEANAFVLTNSYIAATDVVVVNVATSTATTEKKYYSANVVDIQAGQCTISVGNLNNGALPAAGTDAPVLSFVVIKGVTT